MDKNLDNAIDRTERSSEQSSDQAPRISTSAARSNSTRRSASTDTLSLSQAVSEVAQAPTAEGEGNEVEIRFEKHVAARFLRRQGEVLVLAPLHDFRWKEIMVVGRGLADTFAAICELPAETFAASPALGIREREAQPVLHLTLPQHALTLLQGKSVLEKLNRALDLLGNDALTSLPTADLAAQFELDALSIESVKRLRMSVPGRRLESRLEIRIPGQKDAIVVSSALCEPYSPTPEKVHKTYRGRFSGYDHDDRLAHFRPDRRSKRLDISFDEPKFFDDIRENCAPKRIILDLDVEEELVDDVPVSCELVSMRVVQEELKFDAPVSAAPAVVT